MPQSKQANSYATASAGAVFDNYVGIFVDGNSGKNKELFVFSSYSM